MRWNGHAECIGQTRYTHKILVGKSKGRDQL